MKTYDNFNNFEQNYFQLIVAKFKPPLCSSAATHELFRGFSYVAPLLIENVKIGSTLNKVMEMRGPPPHRERQDRIYAKQGNGDAWPPSS